jgi:ParB family transcriptional regulator, chromosome partitioning protein
MESKTMVKKEAGETYQEVDINKLKRNPNNPRGFVHVEDVAELSASIRRVGILQPIVIKSDYQIIAGERRYVAAMAAGLKTIPAVFREIENDSDLIDIGIIENIQRKNLSPIKEAEVYALLLADGITITKLSERLGIGSSKISALIKLLSLPEFIQEAIDEDKISINGGGILNQIEDKELQKQIAIEAMENNFSSFEIKKAKEQGSARKVRLNPLEEYNKKVNRALDKIEDSRTLLSEFPEYGDDLKEAAAIKVDIRKIQERIEKLEMAVADKMIDKQKQNRKGQFGNT